MAGYKKCQKLILGLYPNQMMHIFKLSMVKTSVEFQKNRNKSSRSCAHKEPTVHCFLLPKIKCPKMTKFKVRKKRVSKINLRIISKPYAHLTVKTYVKFLKNRNKTVVGRKVQIGND